MALHEQRKQRKGGTPPITKGSSFSIGRLSPPHDHGKPRAQTTSQFNNQRPSKSATSTHTAHLVSNLDEAAGAVGKHWFGIGKQRTDTSALASALYSSQSALYAASIAALAASGQYLEERQNIDVWIAGVKAERIGIVNNLILSAKAIDMKLNKTNTDEANNTLLQELKLRNQQNLKALMLLFVDIQKYNETPSQFNIYREQWNTLSSDAKIRFINEYTETEESIRAKLDMRVTTALKGRVTQAELKQVTKNAQK